MSDPMPANHPKILIVDDDIKNRKVILKFFHDKDFELLQASDGQSGYEIAVKELPDVILMDWAMPIMNGIDTILKLKATAATKYIPVVMATGVMTSVEDLRQSLEAGAMDYLRKPFDTLELEARISSALRLGRSYRELEEKNQKISEHLEKEKTFVDKEKEFYEREIEHKKREMALQAMHANEKDEFLDLLANQLKEALDNPSTSAIRNMVKEIKSRKDSEKSWDQYTMHFEKVHPDFFTRLKTQYEELTPHDLKLCSYLKMGLVNKDIASITNVGLPSVKSSLYRLKKKLEMEMDDDLRGFMLKF